MSGQAHRPEDSADEKPEHLEASERDAGGASSRSADDSADDSADAELIDAEAALVELQAKANENWDRYLRAAAELENVRKRAGRDVEKARKFALESFGRELLAVKDSLEMGLQAGDSADPENLLAGSEATLKLFATTLERFGIAELNPEGEPFDPEFHEAMTTQPSADAEPGSVLTVVQKGYSLNGRLLRPAMVVVAAEPPSEAAEE